MNKYIYWSISIITVAIVLIDYMMKPKIIHSLECVLDSVRNGELNTTTQFGREEAIANGYHYKLEVQNDGILFVNGIAEHKQDKN